jgi:hypothetical protein
MSFADKYVRSLSASNLRDDERHTATEALAASGLADVGGLGWLLNRVRCTVGDAASVAKLHLAWRDEVVHQGKARKWAQMATEWDARAALALFQRVADRSLAHWFNGKCECCGGVGRYTEYLSCGECGGTGEAPLVGGGAYELERIKDMVSLLRELEGEHSLRAARLLRDRPAGHAPGVAAGLVCGHDFQLVGVVFGSGDRHWHCRHCGTHRVQAVPHDRVAPEAA